MEWKTKRFRRALSSGNDADAWEYVNNHFGLVFHNLASKLGIPSCDIPDAVQQALSVCFVELEKYDDSKGHLHSWFYGIAKRTMLNFKRKLPRERPFIEYGTGGESLRLKEGTRAGSKGNITAGSREIIELSAERTRREFGAWRYRVFELHALRGESADTVAKRMGTSKNNVCVISCRVHRRIREIALGLEGTSQGG